MIYDYALDPRLVAQWADPKEYAFYREAFSEQSGRVGCAFPNEWKRQVLSEFQRLFPRTRADSVQRQRLDVLLSTLTPLMLKRDSQHDPAQSWLEIAECEHARCPFRGILSEDNPRQHEAVMTPDTLFGDRLPTAWSVPPNPAIPRTPTELATAIAPILRTCRKAVFIDPHFRPGQPRFRETLKAMLSILWTENGYCANAEAELLLSEGKQGAEYEKSRADHNHVLSKCKQNLPAIIPPGRKLKVTLLREREGSEKVHNRYVLTKLVGVSFGIGLDAADSEGDGQTDDLCRLSSAQLKTRWGQYVSARPSWFDTVGEPLTITG